MSMDSCTGPTRATHAAPAALLTWHCAFLLIMAVSPADRQHWLLVNLLPGIFVGALVASYRRRRLSSASYAMIAAFLSLHSLGAHYTYAAVPVGRWTAALVGSGRNDFDRITHFAFGLLLTYPLLEVIARGLRPPRAAAFGLAFLTQASLAGAWEVLEAAVAQLVHPEQGLAYLGAQGDLWDAQHDMAAALIGSVVCLVALAFWRSRAGEPSPLPAELRAG
jgi:putative membrane protein